MSVNRTYKLPWEQFDADKIEAAARAIAAAITGLSVNVERCGDTDVSCYFTVPREVGRAWEGPELDTWFEPGQPPVADPLLIEVDFTRLEAEGDSPEDLFLMIIDMGHCANGMLWNLAVEIVNQFCRYWEIEPERW